MRDESGDQKLPLIRPRLAASLILTRGARDNLEVLMGRRSARHVFMPNKYVFPGGRVDRADNTAPLAADLTTEPLSVMQKHLTERRARAAAVVAVRETAEETGLLIAAAGEARSRHPHWRPFQRDGLLPDLSGLRLITRAITPPGRKRRFDTWFFTADVSALADDRSPVPSDELEDVHWVALPDAKKLDLPIVTHFVLDELLRVQPPEPQPVRCFRARYGRMLVEEI